MKDAETTRFHTRNSSGTHPCPFDALKSEIKIMTSEDQSSGNIAPHRGVLVCLCGILGFGCPVFGIVAWVLASNDLAGMASGSVDAAGAGLTRLGKTIAIIGIVFFAIMLLYALLWGDGSMLTSTGINGPEDAGTLP